VEDRRWEREKGLDYGYLADVPEKRERVGDGFQTAGFGIAAQLFSSVAKFVIEKLGPEEGEALLEEAVKYFGNQRGSRIADRVRAQGKPVTFKNWLIYSDIDARANFHSHSSIDAGDLVVRVDGCTFCQAAEEWGLGDYAAIYCRVNDPAIIEGYSPDVKLILKERQATGEDFCLFRYVVKKKDG
jgi:hypothetical protein